MKLQSMTEHKSSAIMSHDEFVAYAQAAMKRLEGDEGNLVEAGMFTYVFSWRSIPNSYGHPAITFEWYNEEGK